MFFSILGIQLTNSLQDFTAIKTVLDNLGAKNFNKMSLMFIPFFNFQLWAVF